VLSFKRQRTFPHENHEEHLMNDLMTHVERIVRPVRADWSKLRMRRELLAHLQASYNEERARGLDEPAAVAAAIRRLGDPAVLTAQLQASVSRFERLAVTPFPGSHLLDRLAGRFADIPALLSWGRSRPPATPFRLSSLLAVAAVLPVLILALPTPAFLASSVTPAAASDHPRLLIAAAVLALEGQAALYYVLCVNLIVIGTAAGWRPWRRVAALAAATVLAGVLWKCLLDQALIGHPLASPLTQSVGEQILLLTLILPGALIAALTGRRVRPWLSLDLAE
jgi:hypothetical protein